MTVNAAEAPNTESPYPEFPGVDPYGTRRPAEFEREHRQRTAAIGYRIFATQRWGQLGDGHISARDPEWTDHFWMLDWGIPFGQATVDHLVLVGPGGRVRDLAGDYTGAVNTAGYNIHAPLLEARPDVVSAAHTHTQFGTPWSANVEPFKAISQESCAYVFDQALFDDEEVEVLTYDGGKRIAAALGSAKLCILRNHGLLTVGQTVEEAVGWFVMAERVAEVHVKAPNAKPISDEAAAVAASTVGDRHAGWRVFQWLAAGLADHGFRPGHQTRPG
ncbi:MAG: class II aldolase/adducin family protein [Acidimicrobiia bacterium]|nr:class II aldolase/adducin family protein [Acidimicrobiia bacterium]